MIGFFERCLPLRVRDVDFVSDVHCVRDADLRSVMHAFGVWRQTSHHCEQSEQHHDATASHHARWSLVLHSKTVRVRIHVQNCRKYLFCSPYTRKRRLRKQSSFSVIFAFRRVILLRSYIWLTPSYIALRAVLEANIISLQNEVKQYHYEQSE